MQIGKACYHSCAKCAMMPAEFKRERFVTIAPAITGQLPPLHIRSKSATQAPPPADISKNFKKLKNCEPSSGSERKRSRARQKQNIDDDDDFTKKQTKTQ